MLRSLFFALKRPTFPHVWEALAAGKSSVSEESERFIADVSGICSGMGTFIWRTCWLFRFEHRLVFLGRGHDSGQVRVSPCCLRGVAMAANADMRVTKYCGGIVMPGAFAESHPMTLS